MDVPQNDDDKSSDGENKEMAAVEGEAAACDEDLTFEIQSLALTTPEKNKGNRTLSDNIRGRHVLDRPSKKSAIPKIKELQVETLSSPPKNKPTRKSQRQLHFPERFLSRELSTGCGNQPNNPFEERNQSMMNFSTDVPNQQSSGEFLKWRWTTSSSEDDSKQRWTSSSSEDDSKQQSTSSADSLKRRWTPSLPEDNPKQQGTRSSPEGAATLHSTPSSSSSAHSRKQQRWALSSPEDDPKQRRTPSSSATAPKQRWTQSSPEEYAILDLILSPVTSPTKRVPEQEGNLADLWNDFMESLSLPFENILTTPPKATTKRNIETSACEGEPGSSSPDAKRHRKNVAQPMGQSSPRMGGRGSRDPPVRGVRKRRYSSALETEGEEKKSKDEKD